MVRVLDNRPCPSGDERSAESLVQARLLPPLIDLLDPSSGHAPSLPAILELFRSLLSIPGAALRLHQGGDFPFLVSLGLEDDFLLLESSLCSESGAEPLACLCGTVLEGRGDPAQPWWSTRGSFFCQDCMALERNPLLRERIPAFRGRCFEEGFRSLALIPLPGHPGPLGLLHLSSPVPQAFPHALPALERAATLLSMALAGETPSPIRGGLFEGKGCDDASADPSIFPTANETRLLLVEDNDGDGRLIELLLEECSAWKGSLVRVDCLAAAKKALKGEHWDAVLLDLGLPDSQGCETLEQFSRHAENTPVIVLTGNADQRTASDAMHRGAQDYLVKGTIDGDGLMRSLRYAIERKGAEIELLRHQKLRCVGELAGGIAHDFNNLLGAIQANASFLKDHAALDHEFADRLEDVDEACGHAKNLTDRLLTFARGGAPIRVRMDLGPLCRSVCHYALAGGEVRWSVHVDEALWPCAVDEGQFSQALENVLRNAAHAMKGRGLVEIRLENLVVDDAHPPRNGIRFLAHGRYVRIGVSDRGEGIPEGLVDRIFDPYFSTWSGKSGLGLSTAYSILRRHEGAIEVRPRLGGGCEMSFLLPAAREEDEPATRHRSSHTGRILVLDDEPLIRRMSATLLDHLGYEATTASEGAEALRLYQNALDENRPYDLVLMDLTIPGGMGGVETLEELRRIDPEVRAVVSSGYSHDPVMAEYRRFGFVGVVAKPYRMQALAEVLRACLADEPSD